MATIVDAMSAVGAVEILSMVWMEVTMASLAAMVWFTITGGIAVQKGMKKLDDSQDPPKVQSSETPSPAQLATKALRQGKLREAVGLIQHLPETVDGRVPASVAPRLLTAAAKAPSPSQALVEIALLAGKIETRAFEASLSEAVKNNDADACRQLQAMRGPLAIPQTPKTMEILARFHASDLSTLRQLVEEADAPLPKPFACAVLEACASLRDTDLAIDVFEKANEEDAAELRAVAEQASKTPSKPPAQKPKAVPGADASRANVPKDAASIAKEIKMCGKNGDLNAAFKIFRKQSGNASIALLTNSALEACIECGDFNNARDLFEETKANGATDTVSFNIMIKGSVAQGDESLATRLLAEISERGLVASHASYHGILNARVCAGKRSSAWQLVEEMQAVGVVPNMVTCSILLKSKTCTASDISRILLLADVAEQPMDEILFSAIAEACIRTNRLDLLSEQLAKFAEQGNSSTLTAATYGSMIRAFGQVRDVKRVSELWNEMMSKKVQPTAITLGCMVDALVANGRIVDARELVKQMCLEETTRPLVNTVIYTTMFKGFTNTKDTTQVMDLYKEMQANGLQPNAITYNTILNVFAQIGAMDHVPALLEDMKTANPPVEPDVVTYSTLVKGFCNTGNLDRALQILQDMVANGKYAPDEVMYNSLLDGCAKEHRPDDALKLLADMKKSGVPPSNYTLSMLVKLMGRCRRLNQAFNIVDEISREYGLKVNVQVYTCLIQACFNNRQANKGVALHDRIIKEGVVADEMTYTVLVRGCLQAGLLDKAVEIAKFAHGVGLPAGKGWSPGINKRCLDELVSALGGVGSAAAKALQTELGSYASSSRQGGRNCKGSGGWPQVHGLRPTRRH